jgi:hypothetical protein
LIQPSKTFFGLKLVGGKQNKFRSTKQAIIAKQKKRKEATKMCFFPN